MGQVDSDPPVVACAVVTYNSEATIERALRSIPEEIRVIVVDNGSVDGTRGLISRTRPDAELVEHVDNRGFAAAVNVAIARSADAPFVLLLNPDARLEPGAVRALLGAMDRHPRAAAVSARIQDEVGTAEAVSGGWEPTLVRTLADALGLSRWSWARSFYCPPPLTGDEQRGWVAGTAVLLRSQALERVGGFDESYFLYCEDLDWCRRARRGGWEIWVTASARVVHERSGSVSNAGEWVDLHRIGNLTKYYASTHGPVSTRVFGAVRAIGMSARAVAFGAAGLLRRDAALRSRSRQRWRDARLALGLSMPP